MPGGAGPNAVQADSIPRATAPQDCVRCSGPLRHAVVVG